MRSSLKIINGKVSVYEEELEELQNFAKSKNGKIIWNTWEIAVERGDEEVNMVLYLCRDGIYALMFEDV